MFSCSYDLSNNTHGTVQEGQITVNNTFIIISYSYGMQRKEMERKKRWFYSWGQSKNTLIQVGVAGSVPGIFTLTPNVLTPGVTRTCLTELVGIPDVGFRVASCIVFGVDDQRHVPPLDNVFTSFGKLHPGPGFPVGNRSRNNG